MRFDNLSGLIGEDVLFSPKREGADSFELHVVGFGRDDKGEVILWGLDENHELNYAHVRGHILTCVTEEEEESEDAQEAFGRILDRTSMFADSHTGNEVWAEISHLLDKYREGED